MPIDESQFVDPLRRNLDPQGHPEDLISPFDIAVEARKMKEADPTIGSIEELEGMLSFGTGMLSMPIAGFAGVIRQVAQKNNLLDSELFDYEYGFEKTAEEGATQVIEDVSQALTYEPRTEGGKKYAARLATPFEYIEKGAQYVGDRIYDVTGSPSMGAMGKTATMFAVPKAIKKGYAGAKWTGKQALSGAAAVVESVNMFRAKPRKAFAQEAVSRSLRQNIGDSAEVTKNIEASQQLAKEIPGFEPTLAETTLKPSVMVRERSLAEAEQATFDIAKSRREQNILALEDFRREHFGDSSKTITDIFRKSKGNINHALNALEVRMSKLDEMRNKVAERSPQMELDVVGRKLREIEKEQYLTAKAYGGMLYEKIGNARVDPAPITKGIDALFKDELLDFAQKEIPSSFNYIKRKLAPEKLEELPPAKTMAEQLAREEPALPTKDISFDTLRSLEKRLKTDLASERGKVGGSKQTERMLSVMLEKVDEVKNNMRETADAGVVKALDNATNFWREGVAERFYKGAGRDIDAKTPFNEFRIVDEKVIDSFFTTATKGKGGVKGIDDFINTYGMNSEAWAQLRIGIHQKFRQETGVNKTGVIDTKRAAVFLNKYGAVLDRIPQIKRELSSAFDISKNLDGTAQMIKQREANINHSILAKTLKSNTPDTIVKASIKPTGRDMAKLRTMARKVKGGIESLSQSIGRELLNMAERVDGTINSAKLLNLMDKNNASIKLGMGIEHFRALKTLHAAYLRLDKNVLPSLVKEQKLGLEKISETFGTTPAQAISAWRAKSRGLVGGPHLVAQLATSFITRINKRQIDAIERIAHYDKNVAKTLMMMTETKKMTPKVERRLSKHLMDYGLMSVAESTKERVE